MDRKAKVQDELRALEAAATGGHWQACACRDGLFEVRAGNSIIERSLPEAFARYLVLLHEASTFCLATRPNAGWALSRRRRDLAQKVRSAMTVVRAEWVFVAPSAEGESFFLHDCVKKVGAGTLLRANALFIDAAKRALPLLLEMNESFDIEVPPDTQALVIPKRARADNVHAEYSAYAGAANALHALSGRNELGDRTEAMTRAILHRMDFGAAHRVLDIGCGDATLLRALRQSVRTRIGTVVTEPERQRLIAEPDLEDIEFITASLDDLSSITGIFDRIVANGCFHFVRTRVAAERALKALSSLAAPQGKLWIGELLATEHRRRVFASKPAAWRYVRRRYGTAFALAFTRHIWRRRHRAGVVVDPPPRDWWHVRPDDFVALAERHGFEVEGVWDCGKLTGDTFYALQNRYSCLLRKL